MSFLLKLPRWNSFLFLFFFTISPFLNAQNRKIQKSELVEKFLIPLGVTHAEIYKARDHYLSSLNIDFKENAQLRGVQQDASPVAFIPSLLGSVSAKVLGLPRRSSALVHDIFKIKPVSGIRRFLGSLIDLRGDEFDHNVADFFSKIPEILDGPFLDQENEIESTVVLKALFRKPISEKDGARILNSIISAAAKGLQGNHRENKKRIRDKLRDYYGKLKSQYSQNELKQGILKKKFALHAAIVLNYNPSSSVKIFDQNRLLGILLTSFDMTAREYMPRLLVKFVNDPEIQKKFNFQVNTVGENDLQFIGSILLDHPLDLKIMEGGVLRSAKGSFYECASSVATSVELKTCLEALAQLEAPALALLLSFLETKNFVFKIGEKQINFSKLLKSFSTENPTLKIGSKKNEIDSYIAALSSFYLKNIAENELVQRLQVAPTEVSQESLDELLSMTVHYLEKNLKDELSQHESYLSLVKNYQEGDLPTKKILNAVVSDLLKNKDFSGNTGDYLRSYLNYFIEKKLKETRSSSALDDEEQEPPEASLEVRRASEYVIPAKPEKASLLAFLKESLLEPEKKALVDQVLLNEGPELLADLGNHFSEWSLSPNLKVSFEKISPEQLEKIAEKILKNKVSFQAPVSFLMQEFNENLSGCFLRSQSWRRFNQCLLALTQLEPKLIPDLILLLSLIDLKVEHRAHVFNLSSYIQEFYKKNKTKIEAIRDQKSSNQVVADLIGDLSGNIFQEHYFPLIFSKMPQLKKHREQIQKAVDAVQKNIHLSLKDEIDRVGSTSQFVKALFENPNKEIKNIALPSLQRIQGDEDFHHQLQVMSSTVPFLGDHVVRELANKKSSELKENSFEQKWSQTLKKVVSNLIDESSRESFLENGLPSPIFVNEQAKVILKNLSDFLLEQVSCLPFQSGCYDVRDGVLLDEKKEEEILKAPLGELLKTLRQVYSQDYGEAQAETCRSAVVDFIKAIPEIPLPNEKMFYHSVDLILDRLKSPSHQSLSHCILADQTERNYDRHVASTPLGNYLETVLPEAEISNFPELFKAEHVFSVLNDSSYALNFKRTWNPLVDSLKSLKFSEAPTQVELHEHVENLLLTLLSDERSFHLLLHQEDLSEEHLKNKDHQRYQATLECLTQIRYELIAPLASLTSTQIVETLKSKGDFPGLEMSPSKIVQAQFKHLPHIDPQHFHEANDSKQKRLQIGQQSLRLIDSVNIYLESKWRPSLENYFRQSDNKAYFENVKKYKNLHEALLQFSKHQKLQSTSVKEVQSSQKELDQVVKKICGQSLDGLVKSYLKQEKLRESDSLGEESGFQKEDQAH